MKNGLNQSNENSKKEFCSMCGAIRGDFWETRPARAVLLQLRPRYGDTSQYWIICAECDEGLKSLIRSVRVRIGTDLARLIRNENKTNGKFI